MNNAGIILHHDEGTLGSFRVRKVLALKQAPWASCPLVPGGDSPGPLESILSGAMGQPVLQQGSTLWASELAVVDALETLIPEPTIFPNGNRGMPLALLWWSNAFADTDKADQWHAHVALIDRQLADGRNFLQGAKAGLADVYASAGLESATSALASAGDNGFSPTISRWRRRVAALGDGERSVITVNEALSDISANSTSLVGGETVQVSRLDSDGEPHLQGTDLGSGPSGLSIQVIDPQFGPFTAHFPAIGYQTV